MIGEDDGLAKRLGSHLAQAVQEQARGRKYPIAWASLEREAQEPEIVEEDAESTETEE